MSEFLEHRPMVTDVGNIDIDHIVDTVAAHPHTGPHFIHVGGVSSAGKSMSRPRYTKQANKVGLTQTP